MPASNRLPSDSDYEKLPGPATGNTGTDVGPPLPAHMMPLAGHKQANPASVVSTPKGASQAQRGGRGAPPAMPGDTPLTGHSPVDPRGVGASAPGPTILSGNHNPVRGSGKTTPTDEGTRRKLSTAGS